MRHLTTTDKLGLAALLVAVVSLALTALGLVPPYWQMFRADDAEKPAREVESPEDDSNAGSNLGVRGLSQERLVSTAELETPAANSESSKASRSGTERRREFLHVEPENFPFEVAEEDLMSPDSSLPLTSAEESSFGEFESNDFQLDDFKGIPISERMKARTKKDN